MEKGIFQFVIRYSKKEQIYLLVMAMASLPFYFFSLDLPKQIVDNAIKGAEKGITFPIESAAGNLEEIIEELKHTRVSERSGRPMGADEDESSFERLRADGYM